MTLPPVFRTSPSANITYNWVDYLAGAGYITFYGASHIVTGWTKKYILTTQNTVDSSSGSTADAAWICIWTEYTASAAADIDFDYTFKKAATVGGASAYINATAKVDNGDSVKFTATIYHYDGTTETSLGTTTDIHASAGGVDSYFRQLLVIPDVTIKAFAVGDTLRLNISAVNGGNIRIYHDPASKLSFTDQHTRTVGTDLIFNCPFKVVE